MKKIKRPKTAAEKAAAGARAEQKRVAADAKAEQRAAQAAIKAEVERVAALSPEERELELLEAYFAGEEEIDARPTFGSILSMTLKEQAEIERQKHNGDSGVVAQILDEVSDDKFLLKLRRGEDVRAYAMDSAVPKAYPIAQPVVKIAVNAAIQVALERSGPSGLELTEKLQEQLGLNKA